MSISSKKNIKEIIKEYLSDGKERTTKEIKEYVTKQGIEIGSNSSILSNALHYLKNNEANFHNIARGVYVWITPETESNKCQETNNKYDFSDFDTISPVRKKEAQLVVSVFENGTFALNTYLLEHFPQYEAEIKLKRDCSQLALIKNGQSMINLGKNGRIKNYDVSQRIEAKKIMFPVYYVGKWDANNEVWIGDLVTQNPNKPKKE